MGIDYAAALQTAIATAEEAARALRAEFHRPGGPRGRSGHAPIDEEVEAVIRDRLEAFAPRFGLRAEELSDRNRAPAAGETHYWLVDPNDGTSAMQAGFRGAAVSIALIRDDLPVVGVICTYCAPDDAGDLFAWAEGCGPVTRNGHPLAAPAWPAKLGGEHTVLVSQHADQKSAANAKCVAPARFRSFPGIAGRLALVAAGEAVAAVSLFAPRDYDYAGGHALLRGAGGELFDQHGRVVRYSLSHTTGTGYCFGGGEAVARELSGRRWDDVLGAPKDPAEPDDLVWPEASRHVADPGVLSRAQGAWLGQLAGDALGSLVEFRSPPDIAAEYPDGPRLLRDGGTFNTLAGQPTDDSEMALLLARTLARSGRYDADEAAAAYVRWLDSGPFDLGGTIGQALRGGRGRPTAAALRASANPDSQANGALMRISPLGVFGWSAPPEQLAEWARADASLTHPHAACGDTNAVYCVALAAAVRDAQRGPALHAFALKFAQLHAQGAVTWLDEAPAGPPDALTSHMGWVRWAFTLAFHHVFHDTPFEAALVDTVRRGGDTDTNAAIVGALLGAIHGREAIPFQWRDRVLTCRPVRGLAGVKRPRPKCFFPVDALVLAERLLYAGKGQ